MSRLHVDKLSRLSITTTIFRLSIVAIAVAFWLICRASFLCAEVPTGSREQAEAYYKGLALKLSYSTPENIGQTTLTDLAAYLGYVGLTADALEFDSPKQLMARGTSDEVLVSRFFAPKIMNVKFKEGYPCFKLGWRKLVRLKAKAGSAAQVNKIAAAVILFNFFTTPEEQPFGRSNASVNTQVMLLPVLEEVWPLKGQAGTGEMDAVYWLDYQHRTETEPGKLGYALNASFDANELPGEGTKDYFVPHGCVACHGENHQRSLVNFLDTDHWFDRLENDFPNLKKSNRALLHDAVTNDSTTPEFREAFDVIRTFNEEADQRAHQAQPAHDESLASAKWLELHEKDYAPVPPIKRAIGIAPHWSIDDAGDQKALSTLNQYCYRCHGTVRFSVFDKAKLLSDEQQAKILTRLDPNAESGLRMPPDRRLGEPERKLILDLIRDND